MPPCAAARRNPGVRRSAPPSRRAPSGAAPGVAGCACRSAHDLDQGHPGRQRRPRRRRRRARAPSRRGRRRPRAGSRRRRRTAAARAARAPATRRTRTPVDAPSDRAAQARATCRSTSVRTRRAVRRRAGPGSVRARERASGRSTRRSASQGRRGPRPQQRLLEDLPQVDRDGDEQESREAPPAPASATDRSCHRPTSSALVPRVRDVRICQRRLHQRIAPRYVWCADVVSTSPPAELFRPLKSAGPHSRVARRARSPSSA